jgi:hypothetical protein
MVGIMMKRHLSRWGRGVMALLLASVPILAENAFVYPLLAGLSKGFGVTLSLRISQVLDIVAGGLAGALAALVSTRRDLVVRWLIVAAAFCFAVLGVLMTMVEGAGLSRILQSGVVGFLMVLAVWLGFGFVDKYRS